MLPAPAVGTTKTKLLWGPLDGAEVTVGDGERLISVPFSPKPGFERGAVYLRKTTTLVAVVPGSGAFDHVAAERFVFGGWAA